MTVSPLSVYVFVGCYIMQLRVALIAVAGLLFLPGCDMLSPSDPWLELLDDAYKTFQSAAERFDVSIDWIATASFESLNLYVAKVATKGPISPGESRPIAMIFFTYKPHHKLYLLVGEDPSYQKVRLSPRQVLLAVADLGGSPMVELRALENAPVFSTPLTVKELDPDTLVNWRPPLLKVEVSAIQPLGIADFQAKWCVEQLDTSETNYRQLTFCFPVRLDKGIGGR